ncbi:MAG: MBL fold metallo-hydrolase [Acidimicrobiales bacterium]|nr:MBL fold metallo-hydrolase [Acidimicrobiales bacterium]
METRAAEVADGIHQLTTHFPEMNFGFNQYLITGDEPLLFHTGMRGIFPLVAPAAATVLPLDQLRWISFGHLEADESGAMNDWLDVAPAATVVQGQIGCMVSIGDLAARPPRPLADGEVLDIGGHRLRWLDTPHVPHSWDAGAMFDETTGTLFCGDLFAAFREFGPTTDDDLLAPALADDEASGWGSWSLHPTSGAQVRRLAELDVRTLAPMHAAAFTGDCTTPLLGLADALDRAVAAPS